MPEIRFFFQLNISRFKDRILSSLFLCPVVFQTAERRFGNQEDNWYVDDGHQSHQDIGGIPHDTETCHRTDEDNHDSDHSLGNPDALDWSFAAEISHAGFSKIVVSEQRGKGK